MKKAALWILVAAALACVGVCLYMNSSRPVTQADLEREFERMPPHDRGLDDFKAMDKLPFDVVPDSKKKPATARKAPGSAKRKVDVGERPDEPTAEEKAEAEAEKLVEAFDALTDRWTEFAKPGKAPTMSDIDAFVEQFRKVPADRKDECIHRALNLIPDENVMLLAGVLMDKSQDSETISTVFSDILNRDESVKLPVLREVIKDTKHPCWKDAAWILDVTKQAQADN